MAFVLGTNCYWLTSLAVNIGRATIWTAIATFVERFDTIIYIITIFILARGVIQLWRQMKN